MKKLALLVLLGSAASSAQTPRTPMQFAGRRFSIDLPPEYRFPAQASPSPAMTTFAFTTAAHADGTRGLIQVSLVDLRAMPRDEGEMSLSAFGAAMIDGVRHRRAQWQETRQAATVAGVSGMQIQWSGSDGPSPELAAQHAPALMHGTMLVGIRDHIGFVLHTQDLDTYWATSGPRGTRALRTFTFQSP
jgi:hypothetical protein